MNRGLTISNIRSRPHWTKASSLQFSSLQGGIYALGKVHVRSNPTLRSFPKVAFETVLMFV